MRGMTTCRQPPRSLLIALVALMAGSAASTVAAEPATFVLDPTHSFVHFELLHFGTSTIRGRFGAITGAVLVDPSAQRGEISIRLPTASVSTGVPVFDARIRAADLLASEAHPEAYFVATRFNFEGDRVTEVRGEFTLRGISQPLSLHALRYGCRREADAATGSRTEICGGDFEGEFKRSDFGATFGLPFIADRVRLQVQVEGRR
jgi:polyisoprenoid-binding protein YceI